MARKAKPARAKRGELAQLRDQVTELKGKLAARDASDKLLAMALWDIIKPHALSEMESVAKEAATDAVDNASITLSSY